MGRLLGVEEMEAERRDLRRRGLELCFANGHFDLIHVGHVRYLQASKAEADRLLVAINDDESVSSLKGPGRPLVPAAERAEILSALACVDYVVIFSGDSPASLIRRLEPEVHCKGTDYELPENVPEHPAVAAYGGRTRLVGDPKDHATRDLIAAAKVLP